MVSTLLLCGIVDTGYNNGQMVLCPIKYKMLPWVVYSFIDDLKV